MILFERSFTLADQKSFAAVSGDYNPIHVDPLLARRTQAGAPVVHGIHLLLCALDAMVASDPQLPPFRGLKAQFAKFVFLDENVSFHIAKRRPESARLTIEADSIPRSRVIIHFGSDDLAISEWSGPCPEATAILADARPLTFEEMTGRTGSLPFVMQEEDAKRLFPAASRWIGAERIAALASTTYLVGMECPGLHSIYSDLDVNAVEEFGRSLMFRVTGTDALFRSFLANIVGGGISGTVKGFFRTPPVEQASMTSLVGVVALNEFVGAVALVIGGSRGLGELTAKLLASGGARVFITYHSGKADAEKVAEEIRAFGGTCDTLPFDSGQPVKEQLAELPADISHCYYFATPIIARPHQAALFSSERLRQFTLVYVEAFWQVFSVLYVRSPSISVFYPSTIYMEDRPKGMTEYAMAKTAGETLAADINAYFAPAHVTVKRLPRLPTDQTATVFPAEAADPVRTLLPIVREVQSSPRKG